MAKVQEGPSMTHPTSSLLCREVEHMWSFCVQPQHCKGPDSMLKVEKEGNKWWNIVCLRFQGLYAAATCVSLGFPAVCFPGRLLYTRTSEPVVLISSILWLQSILGYWGYHWWRCLHLGPQSTVETPVIVGLLVQYGESAEKTLIVEMLTVRKH